MGRQRGGASEDLRADSTNQRLESARHNLERPVQYEYSNEPDDDDDDNRYANGLLQRSRNRHPAFTDNYDNNNNSHDDDTTTTTSTLPTSTR